MLLQSDRVLFSSSHNSSFSSSNGRENGDLMNPLEARITLMLLLKINNNLSSFSSSSSETLLRTIANSTSTNNILNK